MSESFDNLLPGDLVRWRGPAGEDEVGLVLCRGENMVQVHVDVMWSRSMKIAKRIDECWLRKLS